MEALNCIEAGLLWLVVIHQLSQPVPNRATLGVAWQLQQLEKRRASTRPARWLQHNEPHLPFGSSCCRQESRNHVQSYFIPLYSPVIRLSWTCQAWLPRGEAKGFLSSVCVHLECCCKRIFKHIALTSTLWCLGCSVPRPTLTGVASLTPCSSFLPSCGYLPVFLSYA